MILFRNDQEAVNHIIQCVGKDIRLATPLGLGKPNLLLNLLYEEAKRDSTLHLSIHTALSLNPPESHSDFEGRFLDPFRDRQWGKRYPVLEYAKDSEKGQLPPNVRVHEFYFRAGIALKSENLQRDYESINYTHVAENIFQSNVQVIVQLIARSSESGSNRYSLSCNPDVTLDVVDLYRSHSKPLLVIGVVHPGLPFMGGEAEVGAGFFDGIVDDSKPLYELFALPRLPINDIDHLIGFYASQLVKDDGTLQIGIGSLSDAVVASLVLRQTQNLLYSEWVKLIWADRPMPLRGLEIETGKFLTGLYGLSELVTDGFMNLRRAGILKRNVMDEKSGKRTYLHGAFFLGSKEFYEWLRSLEGEESSGLRMSRVSKVNDLYDPHELVLRLQRKNARFLNTCMQVTLLGGAASDTLEDGRVVSGVGGQYNFVSMSHELKNSRSIMMLRSVRVDNGRRRSNIVWSHGHLTIPRHLRDIVITEYGIADLRGKTDEETIIALLNITDSEFQDELCRTAKANRKLAKNYQIPTYAKNNTPEKVRDFFRDEKRSATFSTFPFGSDFTAEEKNIILALDRLKTLETGSKFLSTMKLIRWTFGSMGLNVSPFQGELIRMALDRPKGLKARLMRRLLLSVLSETTG